MKSSVEHYNQSSQTSVFLLALELQKSAEMESRRSYKKTLAFGHFKWEDEIAVKAMSFYIPGERYRIIPSSTLEIIEELEAA